MAFEDDIRECRAVEDFANDDDDDDDDDEDDDDIMDNSPGRPRLDEEEEDDEVDDEMRETLMGRHHVVDDGEMIESLIERSHVGLDSDLIEQLLKRPRIGIDGKMAGNSSSRELLAYDGESNCNPYEGMEFESEEAAKVFYNSYARRVGFSIRVSIYSRSKRDGLIISRRFVCSKEGFRRKRNSSVSSNDGKTKRPRAITREGCKAMIVVKKQSSGKWILSKFVEGHSHPLAPPGKVHCLRSHRGDKDKTIRELTHELERANQKCANYRSQLLLVLKSIEEQLLKKVEVIRQTIREIESDEQGIYLK